MKIAMLGAGAYGAALGEVLVDNGYTVQYYDALTRQETLAEVLAGAEMMVLCVPSQAVPHLLPHLPKDLPMIVATKGILSDQPLAEFKDVMVLSGPGYADDIKAHKETHLTVTDGRIIKMFGTDYLDFDVTEDVRGVLMCGALKNVYAILAGLKALQPGTDEHQQFLDAAAGEMQTILAANGADPATVNCNCGRGDLKITCYYPSRNYEFGQKLWENPDYQPEKTVEGLSALKRIRRGEIELPENLPLLEELTHAIEC
ncbi:MAG: hypothetical protein Q4F56_01940 [Candidatus Saccharibacteria bacterium]|nr:hypothetical protein [Candidatus Saccharibacteria bacterium]